MLRLKRRHTRRLIMGLLVLLTLSWVSLGCYACELGGAPSAGVGSSAHHGEADAKPCHEAMPNDPCPHCTTVGAQHDGSGACESPLCALYKVTADEQVGWSPASADHNLDFHPLLLSAALTVLSQRTFDPHPLRFVSATPPDVHPTTAFCVLLI